MHSKSSSISSSQESGVFHSKCVSKVQSKSPSASFPTLASDTQNKFSELTECSDSSDVDNLKNNSTVQDSESDVESTSSENCILGLPQSVTETDTCNLKSSADNFSLENCLKTITTHCDNTQETKNPGHKFLPLKNSTSSPISGVILTSNVTPGDVTEKSPERRNSVLIIGRDLLKSQTAVLSYKVPEKNLDVELKLGENIESNKTSTSVEPCVTIEKTLYKCKVLQEHSKQCRCSTPRLHLYLTSNHRCTESCSLPKFTNSGVNSCGTSLVQSFPNYTFSTITPEDMSGKSRGRGRRRRSISRKLSRKNPQFGEVLNQNNMGSRITQSSKAIMKNTTLQRKNTIANIRKLNSARNNRREEPESELLQEEECESLPTIMNALSGDVEYIVLDDDALNLNATPKEEEVSPDILKSKINNIYEDIDIQAEVHNTEGRSLNSNRIGLTGRRLSETTNQSLGSRGYIHTTDAENSSEDLTEKASDDIAASSSLDVACTNHAPSLKDIFGDISIKEEPVEDIKQDMTVDDFSKELHKFSGANLKPMENDDIKKEDVKDGESTNGLFANLIKEESTASEMEVDAQSSDDSLGPLQIDEDRVGYLPSVEDNKLPVTKGVSEFSMPSVNIISPFKIKILFGNVTRETLQIQADPSQTGTSGTSIPFIVPTNEIQNNMTGVHSYNQVAQTVATKKFEDQVQSPVAANTIQSLTCIYCNTKCPNGQELAKHFEDHQKEGLIICYFCQKSFGDKTGMKRHMRTHTGEKPYQCNVCGKRFSLPGNFKKHRDIHEDRRTEPCSVCGKTFRRKEHLKYHMRTHTGEKPYTCSECGTSFTARYSLQIHMNIHLGKKPYQCNYCNKAFSDKSTMRKHIRVHTGEKPFRCPECRRCFGESGTLAAHMATHRTERPFKCTKCELRFKTSGGLRQHEKVHSGEKQFACRFCGMRFLQKYNMTMHERIHTGEKPYTCPHCERSFRSRSCLSKHIVLHGGDDERRFHCDHCSSRFYRKAHLRRHIDMHLGIKNYECNYCTKKFCTRGTLKSHMKTFHSQGARRFPCNWCGRVFKRQVYVSTHACIKDNIKTEEGAQETHSNPGGFVSGIDFNQENSTDTDGSSIEVKSEPEDEIIEEEVEEYSIDNFQNEVNDAGNDEDNDEKDKSLVICEDFHQYPS